MQRWTWMTSYLRSVYLERKRKRHRFMGSQEILFLVHTEQRQRSKKGFAFGNVNGPLESCQQGVYSTYIRLGGVALRDLDLGLLRLGDGDRELELDLDRDRDLVRDLDLLLPLLGGGALGGGVLDLDLDRDLTFINVSLIMKSTMDTKQKNFSRC